MLANQDTPGAFAGPLQSVVDGEPGDCSFVHLLHCKSPIRARDGGPPRLGLLMAYQQPSEFCRIFVRNIEERSEELTKTHKAQGWLRCADPLSHTSTSRGLVSYVDDMSKITLHPKHQTHAASPPKYARQWRHSATGAMLTASKGTHLLGIRGTGAHTAIRRLTRGKREPDLHLQGFRGRHVELLG